MAVYNERKMKDFLGDIPKIPEKYTKKKKRPKEVAHVVEGCTGCEACVPFCPVDCIEHVPKHLAPADQVIPPVQIRYDECIGCEICVRVCDKLAWSVIVMMPTDEFEQEMGIPIHDTIPTAAAPAPAPARADAAPAPAGAGTPE
jgi:ferredoxin